MTNVPGVRESHFQRMTVAAAVIGLLAMMALLAGGAARRESVTVDEVAHVGAGVSYLQKLDLRMNEEHPPLVKVVAAVPLVARGAHADYSNVSWSFSNGFFNQYLGQWVFGHWFLTRWNEPVSTLFWARMPMLLLTLALGFVIFSYAVKLGGPAGGLLCLSVYTTMPAFLAFGPLVHTDIAVTLFSLLTVWSVADLWQSPVPGRAVKFGLALGAALLSKFSAGLLFICLVAFALSFRLRGAPEQPTDPAELRVWRRTRARTLIQGILLAAAVVYVVYFVLSWNQSTDSFAIIPHFPESPILRRVLMPPWLYLRGLAGFSMTASRPTYILGKAYPHGVWFYFPILFVLKSQLGFLALLLVALGAGITLKRRTSVQWIVIPKNLGLHWRALWVSLLVFTAACMLSRLTISIRHFFMPTVLLILLLAPLPRMLDSLARSGRAFMFSAKWLMLALAMVCVFTAVRAYPYYFPFLNSLSMGRPAYELVNDSNLDWNQALPDVRLWAQAYRLQRVMVDEYGFSDPAVYVSHAQLWDCQQPSAADAGNWVFVSANMIADGHNCIWLFQYPHQSLAGGSMYAFRLPAVLPPAGAAGGPPLPENWRRFAGMPFQEDIRVVNLRCIRDPSQLQPTMDRMWAMYESVHPKKK